MRDFLLQLGRTSSTDSKSIILFNLRAVIGSTNSRAIGFIARLSLRLFFWVAHHPPSGLHRAISSYLQPRDPLSAKVNLPPLTLVVPAAGRDLQNLDLILLGALRNVRNPLTELLIISPLGAEERSRLWSELTGVLERESPHHKTVLRVVHDDEILGGLVREGIKRMAHSPSGWELQQILKFQAARKTQTQACLILDADTVLLSKKTWLDEDNVQLLQFSEEYHQPYRNLIQRYFQFEADFPASFVTHHQVMQKEFVLELFPTESSLVEWLTASLEPGCRLSEYETYGQHLVKAHPGRAAFGSWANLWSPKLKLFRRAYETQEIKYNLDQTAYNSVSFHAHSQS